MHKLITDKLGDISYEERDIINFPNGLLGFEEFNRYLLIRNDKNELFFFLQSVDEPSLMFVLINPKMVFEEYEMEIHESEVMDMEVEQLVDFCIVTIPEDPNTTTINMLGPIIIDVKNQLGKQVVSLNQNHTTKQPLVLVKEESVAV